ncbi:uncharacterized protein IWZ02DRAFT_29620 [Phyllosticta citriasiana]|uniref:uncharacterized protein n=1 Tax=Phyllosticta citriasiana TaxID=595635 RepID=UPI0030FD60C7
MLRRWRRRRRRRRRRRLLLTLCRRRNGRIKSLKHCCGVAGRQTYQQLQRITEEKNDNGRRRKEERKESWHVVCRLNCEGEQSRAEQESRRAKAEGWEEKNGLNGDERISSRWMVDGVMDDGLDWTGLDWTGLDWTGLDWTGLDWTGLDWNPNELISFTLLTLPSYHI